MKNTKSLFIKVFDLNTTFTINVTTDLGNDAEIEIDKGIDALLVYTINVWPTKGFDFKIACLKNGLTLASSVIKNQLIVMETTELVDPGRYSFTFENNNQVIISIKDVGVKDSGIYTVAGQNSNSFANESITLVITGLPYISLNYNDEFFELNKIYALTFELISFPLTNFTFKRYLCSETECDPSKDDNWIDLFEDEFYEEFNQSLSIDQNHTIVNGDHNITFRSFVKPKYYQIHLDLLANQSSIFKCEVQNDFGRSIKQLPVLVSDAGNEGFELDVLNDELVEDDNITLTCKATKFNYTKIDWKWQFYDEEKAANIEFDKQIVSGETAHSLTSRLTILNAKRNLSGDYRCLADYKKESDIIYEPNSKQVQLVIERMVPPKIIRSNMDKELKIIKVYQTTSINLYCEVAGRPKPTIVWRKNNLPFNSTSLSNGIEFSRDNQHLSIKRLVNDDSGKYECNVFNKGGVQNRVLGLKVQNKNGSALPLAGLGKLVD